MSCTLERYNDANGRRECNCVECGNRYNGWSNYSTWLMNVHDFMPAQIVQDKAERMIRAKAREMLEAGNWNGIGVLNQIAYDLGQEAAESFDGLAGEIIDTLELAGYPETVRRLMTDVLENFRGVVRWTELAGEHVEAARYRMHWNGKGETDGQA